MKKIQYFTILLLILVLLSFSFYFFNSQKYYFQSQSEKDKDLFGIPHPKLTANGDPLPDSAITQNATEIYRLFECINFSIDYSSYSGVNHTKMQISFINGLVIDYDMEEYATNRSQYIYWPKYNAPLGKHNVSFLIYDENNDLLNAHTTFRQFTIKTKYLANFNSSKYYIGDKLSANLTINDFGGYQFDWNITIVDSVNETTQRNLFNLEYNLVYITFEIKNETFNQVDKTYYIKVNMTDKGSGKVFPTYFPFVVLNSIPQIIASSVNFSQTEIYRTDSCVVSLNVTDIENTAAVLVVKMNIKDPNGITVNEINLIHRGGNLFSRSFSIPADRPIGRYKANLTAIDPHNGVGSYVRYLTIKNNPPEIHSYKVNDFSMDESISVLYGKDLVFTFNVSDVEGIAYITVALIDKNNEWYNITRAYTGEDMRIVIRTVELLKGTWYVYIFVTDTDGKTTSLIDDYDLAPQQIRVIPDIISGVIPWVTFFIGLALGILAGIGGSYKLLKSRLQAKQVSPKKKEPIKAVKKPEKKIKKIKEVEPVKETEIEPIKEEEEKPKPTFRKIKRKLK